MANYYEKAFFKLAEQIDRELGYAEETLSKEIKRDEKDIVICNTRGMVFAYGSIKELADRLKAKECDFEDDDYLNYMNNQPMRDGEEICNFLNEVEA